MGIIKAVTGAIRGGFSDQWLEVIEPYDMSDKTVLTTGAKVRKTDKRNANRKETVNTISNGSVIHVYPNQFMMLVDGGKVVDYTAEEGYYIVNNSSIPSMFNGEFKESLKETFSRIKFGGVPSSTQKVIYINLQEIKGIKFGTRSPINYFDTFYNAELFLKAHGTYSIKITNPLQFYAEAVPHNRLKVDIVEINDQYLSEFMEAFQSTINEMSAKGERISFVASKGRELSKYMATTLDEEWNKMRGIEIQAVGIASIAYSEDSAQLINMRNQGAMLSDPAMREGYVQGAVARGIEQAGSNQGGSMQGFMGVGMGMNGATSFVGTASSTNMQQMQNERTEEKSGENPGVKQEWICECKEKNTSNFCTNCGAKRPELNLYRCDKCGLKFDGFANLPKFCPECGDVVNEEDRVK